ncbi:MAG: hypothetical protein NC489_24750, partial [Ruminococcus flavefaciens]|nr:hypothetical protein [Ruminococcus flavefaciens]
MALVNADASAILSAWQNITNAVSSIEATKASVSRKYQQLGTGWSDKKYRELGDVIKECNHSLNTILKILLQAEKPIASLVKSLQEYEETDLSGSVTEQSHLSFME